MLPLFVPKPLWGRPSRRAVPVLLAALFLCYCLQFLLHRVFTPYHRLMVAVESGKASAVKAALDRGADVNGLPDSREDENVSPLGAAAQEGEIEIVRLLLDRGADINMSDSWDPPLTAAAENDRVDVVKLLIARGAKVNDQGEQGSYALYRAAVDGKVAAVRVLLAHGANPNTYFIDGPQKNVLLHAVEELQQPEVAAVLRQAGAK
jgi:ankyrin repeat protein